MLAVVGDRPAGRFAAVVGPFDSYRCLGIPQVRWKLVTASRACTCRNAPNAPTRSGSRDRLREDAVNRGVVKRDSMGGDILVYCWGRKQQRWRKSADEEREAYLGYVLAVVGSKSKPGGVQS
jgi:hypothetical protein